MAVCLDLGEKNVCSFRGKPGKRGIWAGVGRPSPGVCVCVEAGASDSQPEGRGRTGGALGTGIGIRVPFG